MIYVSGPRISRFMVEVVSTPEDMAKGLGYRKSLNQRQGMLFVFPNYSRQSMWMKNMNFPLDIVWLDENKTVTKIYENVQVCGASCESYSSFYKAKYAIELNAFDAARIGLEVGKTLQFSV
jgi:uncharacterized membrane protein (UPF0127 family)